MAIAQGTRREAPAGHSTDSGRVRGILLILLFLLVTPLPANEAPPPADYCRMLARDIEGKQYAFLAGNLMYYIGGKVDVTWKHVYHETLGFSHPIFRDGRARGFGIVKGPGGVGHDKFGWAFWNHIRGAKGTVILDGKRHAYPRPQSMIWRPDRVICTYHVDGVTIVEKKFIALNDVLTSIVTCDKPVTLLFEGHSFVHPGNFPTNWGDKKEPYSRKRTARGEFDADRNTIHITEGGTILTKPDFDTPAMEGRIMYDGLSIALSANRPIGDSQTIRRDKDGRQVYSFQVACRPNQPVGLTYAMGDDYRETVKRTREVLADPSGALERKTAWMNGLLNRQIPYFRCSDETTVKTYYYLWALYLMYFTDIGRGYEVYPHTQTAINNFMGLHLWDSWAYAAMGSWVVDKWNYGFGNVLCWKSMVPFKDKNNALPDNFGTTWYSPGVHMPFVGSVDYAWDMYLKSGDRKYLKVAYDELYRPLYWDKPGPQVSFGNEINAVDALIEMARELGRDGDIPHWQAYRPRMVKSFKQAWESYAPDYYARAGVPWKDIWQLASMLCREMPDEWARAMSKRWVMDPEDGYLGPVALRIRPPNYPPNGVFCVSSISTWLAVEGMFRHHCDGGAVFCTLSHIRGMNRAYGFPVAPECWDPNDRPWGSLYYNWDGCIVDLIIRRLGGIRFSLPGNTFTVADHMPEDWTFMELRTPVTHDGKTTWVCSHIGQKREGANLKKSVTVTGCPLDKLVLEPWLAERPLLASSAKTVANAPDGHFHVAFDKSGAAKLDLTLGPRKEPKKTLVAVRPCNKRTFHKPFTVIPLNLQPGTTLRYSLGEKDPTGESPEVKGPITVDSTTQLRLRTFDPDGTPHAPMRPVPFTKVVLQPATKVTATAPGLRYEIFDGQWKRIPNLAGLKPISTGALKELDVNKLPRKGDYFAVRFTGFIEAPEDGVYNFQLRSDDGSRLQIDGKTVIDLNVLCGRDAWTNTGSVGLEAGYHALTIVYFQHRNRRVLVLKHDLEGHAYKPVSPKQLAHRPEASP